MATVIPTLINLFSSLQIMIFHSTFGMPMPLNSKISHCQIYLGQTIAMIHQNNVPSQPCIH